MKQGFTRREFTTHCISAAAGFHAAAKIGNLLAETPALDRNRPNAIWGASSGDVTQNTAVLWSRADRPSRMIVEISTNESFRNLRKIVGPDALVNTDFTAKLLVKQLAASERMFYRIRFQDLADPKRYSVPIEGQFVTAPDNHRDINFLWSGDTAGQGYGIDPNRGGMKTYETMQRMNPDFFVHSGDLCYSDNPFPAEIVLDDGSMWKNLQTEETSKVAETLDEFRGNFRYNLLDAHVRRFNARVPILAQWDDHETTNNWYPGEELLDDDRYKVKSASLLAARAKQAMFEYLPIASRSAARQSIARSINYGPALELFFLDLRSFRSPNSQNDQSTQSKTTAFLGRNQLHWLKQQLLACRSTWKVICSDMPIGLIVRDGESHFENGANGDGRPLGRELELADLLRFMKQNQIRNVVWLTADVHYAASQYYDPNHATFQDFDPFWEFVSGPLHAGTFGPNPLDNTFGPQLKFCSVPADMKPNRPPTDGLQFFGQVQIDGESHVMTVSHFNVAGEKLWTKDLSPSFLGSH